MAMTTGDLTGFRSGFDRLFRDLESAMMSPTTSMMMPTMSTSGGMRGGSRMGMMQIDMCEKDNMYHMWMDMPGCSKEECNISVDEHKNMLTVTCERKACADPTEEGWLMRERPCGKMSRSVMFPDTADLTKADCKMENGMMCCCIPKREAPGARQLSIK